MLTTAPLIAFVPTTDPKRAKPFFSNTLALKLLSEDPFALTYDAGGTMLRVATVPALTPHPFTILGFQVTDIEAAIRALSAAGVTFLKYPHFQQDALNTWTAPSGARIAWF